MKNLSQLIALTLLLQCSAAWAESVTSIQKRWAVANYELEGDAQSEAFESLISDIELQVEQTPSDPEILIWKGIVESTYAGKASGLSALGLVKSARKALSEAIELDPTALSGSAYTSLGALYYQVPPWPIAFGSNKKARKLLEKSLEVNPDGIDSNYFYGAFLVEEKEYARAREYLNIALQADTRPGRPLADKGRRMEIQTLLNEINAKGE